MGIRIEPVPLISLSAYPTLWQQILEKLETMPEDVARYKSLHRALPTIIEQMKLKERRASN